MRKHDALGVAFYVELVVSAAAAALAVVTLVWNDWIELAFKVDPDSGNGSLEKAIVVVLLAAAIICGWLARTEWRRTHNTAQATIR